MSDHLQDPLQGLAGKTVADSNLELPVSDDDLGLADIRLFSGLACAAALHDPPGNCDKGWHRAVGGAGSGSSCLPLLRPFL
jgi:hypothetical protein